MTTEIIKDNAGNEVIIITNDDGSQTAMLKSIYDAQVEHLTEIIPADEA